MAEHLCNGCQKPLAEGEFHRATARGRRRQVASRCRACRRKDYFAARYPTVCATCRQHRPIEADDTCRVCLQAAGLRLCSGPCARVLPLLFSFYGASKRCKDCRKKALTGGGDGGTTEA